VRRPRASRDEGRDLRSQLPADKRP